jgi:hypothetical protein
MQRTIVGREVGLEEALEAMEIGCTLRTTPLLHLLGASRGNKERDQQAGRTGVMSCSCLGALDHGYIDTNNASLHNEGVV